MFGSGSLSPIDLIFLTGGKAFDGGADHNKALFEEVNLVVFEAPLYLEKTPQKASEWD